jgi:hypothetical protein
MKSLSCDLCETTAEGETFEEWMKALMPHYTESHADVMQERADNADAAEEARTQWMNDNMTRWDEA